MLTYVEAEMEGCRKRATDKWIKMSKMNASAFQPPCKGTRKFSNVEKIRKFLGRKISLKKNLLLLTNFFLAECCKIADMVNEKMVCDGGGVAVPSCDVTTCTWKYDCTNGT